VTGASAFLFNKSLVLTKPHTGSCSLAVWRNVRLGEYVPDTTGLLKFHSGIDVRSCNSTGVNISNLHRLKDGTKPLSDSETFRPFQLIFKDARSRDDFLRDVNGDAAQNRPSLCEMVRPDKIRLNEEVLRSPAKPPRTIFPEFVNMTSECHRMAWVIYFGVHVVLFATMALLTVYVMCMKSFVDPVRLADVSNIFQLVTLVREVP
jgi:hypothetical protein